MVCVMVQFIVIIKDERPFIFEAVKFLIDLGLMIVKKIGTLNRWYVVFVAETKKESYFSKTSKFSFDKGLFVYRVEP